MNIEQRLSILKNISKLCTDINQYAKATDKCWENMKWQIALEDNPERQSNAAMLNLIVAQDKFLEMEKLIQKVKNLADIKNKFILTIYYDATVNDIESFEKPYTIDYTIETNLTLNDFKDFIINLYNDSRSDFFTLGHHTIIKHDLAIEWFTAETLEEWWNRGLINL